MTSFRVEEQIGEMTKSLVGTITYLWHIGMGYLKFALANSFQFWSWNSEYCWFSISPGQTLELELGIGVLAENLKCFRQTSPLCLSVLPAGYLKLIELSLQISSFKMAPD